MHSFVTALIVVALAIFTGAVPIASPDNLPEGVASVLTVTTNPVAVLHLARTDSLIHQPGSAEGHVKSAGDTARRRGVHSKMTARNSIQSHVCARESPPSVAAIYINLANEIQSYIEQSNAINVTDVISMTQESIDRADCVLEALDGQESGVIMASADGDAQLTVFQLTTIISRAISLILHVATHSLGGDPRAVSALYDLFDGAGDIIEDTIALVPDFDPSAGGSSTTHLHL